MDWIDDADRGVMRRWILILIATLFVGGCMSGAIIYTPDTGSDWANAWEQVEYTRKGKLGLSLTNFNNTSLPAIASGSWAEVAGSIYKWSSEEAISGSPTSGYINYIKLVPSGSGDTAIVTATWTTTEPTWSDSYQGFYSSTSRYAGGSFYDGSNYYHKFILDLGRNVLRRFVLEIGDWNMDTTTSVNVTHGIADMSTLRTAFAIVRSDTGGTVHEASLRYISTLYEDLYCIFSDTVAALTRGAGGFFDSSNFDSTSYNRGWVTIEIQVITE